MAGRRKGKGERNAVRDAVERIGGIVPACALLMVSNRTLARWLATGSIPQLDAALKLAKASGVPVQKFAGAAE